ncbi:MAG: TIR domain-containing protein [Anaerolineae bacterium]|nr:TIR domain-containing protein [Anaerolineae bacterium]
MTWGAFLTYDNFSLAWRRIRNSPITTTKDRLGLKIFSQSLNIHIERLIRDLAAGYYEPELPSLLYLPKKSGRLRPFTLLHMRDRLVYQAIGNILIRNVYEELKATADIKVFSPVLAGVNGDYVFYPSLRKGDDFEGQFLKFTRRQAELIDSGNFTWVVQADIASFYPSIDHSLLIQKLASDGWLDERSCDLLRRCLRIWSSDDLLSQVNKGLPIGYETSDLLANLFLQELNLAMIDQEYLRYVDDVRVFTTSEMEGEKILNQLDVFLQKQGLTLQEAKTGVKKLAEFHTETRLQDLEGQQILLSSIDRDINSPIQLIQEETDTRLRKLLMEVLGIQEWDGLNLDERIEPSDEMSLFFALYRIREKNIQLRDIALDLLISHPHRSYAIVQYLTLFQEDELVVERLWTIVDDESKHGQVRANCLRALHNLSDDAPRIRTTIGNWLYDSDLSLSLCAIEVLQQYPDAIYLFNLLDSSNARLDRHLLYSFISTEFVLLNSDDEKRKTISWCLDQGDYILNTLAVYFLSTNIHLLNYFSNNLPDLVQDLIQDFKNRVSTDEVTQNIRKLFGIPHEFDLSAAILPVLSGLNQQVINMFLSRETNRDEYLRNLTEFLVEFSQLYQRMTAKEFSSLIKTSEIQDAFNYSQNGLTNLSDFRSSVTFLGTKPALGYIDTEKIHKGISLIVFHALQEIDALLKDVPRTLLKEEILSDPSPIPMIFFSYSHYDERQRKKLEMKLKHLEIRGLAKLWSDREIPAGQVWNEELNEKLDEAIIVLFLITSNFMASSFIEREEMPRAISNYNQERTVCIPILLEACDWKYYPYEHLQALPKDAKPVTHWTRPDSAYEDIQLKVRSTLESISSGTYKWISLPPKS